MSSRSGFRGAQLAVLIVLAALIAALLWWLLILLRPAAAAVAPTPTLPLAASSTPLPSVTPTATERPTSTATTTLTPSPTPLVPLACLPAEAERVEALVRAVVSGAVIEVEINEKRSFVRYLGVDPAGDGQTATVLNRELVDGQVVTLIRDTGDVDAQGYWLRYVLVGDVFVNFDLVRQGTALVALFPPIQACVDTLLAGESLARQEQTGFWALAAATLPAPGESSGAASCDCRVQYVCTDFASQADAQACYNACGDYRNASLDPDHNGLACDE